MFFQLAGLNPLLILPWLVAIILAISLHEFSHALAGYLQGDDTAQAAGRLTLNPFAHLDWIGLLLLVLVGFGWGKPTPYNPYNLKFPKWGSALVGLAGPVSNLLMALISLTIFKLLGFHSLNWTSATSLLQVFLLMMIELNIMLCIFNLIPIPPLDGSKFLPRETMLKLEMYGPWLLLALILFGGGILSRVINVVLLFLYQIFGLI